MLGTHTCRNESCFKRLDLPVAPYSCVLARTLRKHNFPIGLIHMPCGNLNKSRMGNLCLNNLTSAVAWSPLLCIRPYFPLPVPGTFVLWLATNPPICSAVWRAKGASISCHFQLIRPCSRVSQRLERGAEGDSFTLLGQLNCDTPILSCLLI